MQKGDKYLHDEETFVVTECEDLHNIIFRSAKDLKYGSVAMICLDPKCDDNDIDYFHTDFKLL